MMLFLLYLLHIKEIKKKGTVKIGNVRKDGVKEREMTWVPKEPISNGHSGK